ncbi:MAG: hypothetical protein GY861_11075 [bacterium]|nr:hypothetical protein [bacterium]
MECKNCKSKFHYCDSCSPETCCDNGFCSDECWEGSDDYIAIKERFMEFIASLNSDQEETFNHLIVEVGEEYDDEMVTWFDEHNT